MPVNTTVTQVKSGLGGDDPTLYNTRLQELRRIDLLARSDWPLTDLRDEEIIAFGIFRSLDSNLKYRSKKPDGSIELLGGTPMIVNVIENIRDMRPSRARLGRKELIEAIGKGRPIMPWEQPPQYEQDKGTDEKKWWQFWRRS